jgi:alanyl-tRNA synthetase
LREEHTMSATRLYFDDPHLLSFSATVTAHAEHGGRPALVLDQSAFYPEAGGQMADKGSLADLSVVDTQEDESGRVLHIVDATAPLPAIGARVDGHIEKARRRSHMALHTGQHMLSRALLDIAGGETVSSRLGETECTIDLSKETVSDADLARAEDLVNAIIDDDVVVRAYFPSPDELATLPLRRKPKVSENVRVVDVSGYDVSPCGGTHVTRTGQVGLVHIEKIEKKKGLARLTFSAGPRLRASLFREDAMLREFSRTFSCGVPEVPAAVDKLARDLKGARLAFSRVQGQLAGHLREVVLARMANDTRSFVPLVFDDVDVGFLRALAPALATQARTVVLGARSDEGTHVLVARGPDAVTDAGKILADIASRAGGKGGGKSDLAQGKIPAGADLLTLVESLSDQWRS